MGRIDIVVRPVSAFAVAAVACLLVVGACLSSENHPATGPLDSGTSLSPDTSPPSGRDGAIEGAIPDGDAGAALVLCTDYDASIEYDAAAFDGGRSTIADGGGTLPGPAPTTCSGLGQPSATSILFVNNAPCTLEAWWIDFACNEVFYADIPPNGGTLNQPTFETHVWRLRAAGTEQLLVEIPGATNTTPRTITYP
jgi:hypothetical protein